MLCKAHRRKFQLMLGYLHKSYKVMMDSTASGGLRISAFLMQGQCTLACS